MASDRDLSALAERVRTLAHRAGEAIVEIYQQADHQVVTKSDASPLTAADLASHRCIVEGLEALGPSIPVLSEEGADRPYSERSSWNRFWLVDPLDGTKEFVKRNGEFTVNIALVEDGVPVLGVVHAPVVGRTYWGGQGLGAFLQEGEGDPRTIEAGGTGDETLAVVASRSHAGEHLKAFLADLGDHRLVSMGSSLKLCLVAEGAADLYPRLGPTMEWDTAAAHGVVLAAGGQVLDYAGNPLQYNKENLLNPFFIVLGTRQIPWQRAYGATGLV